MGGGSADEIIMTSITNPEVLAVCYAQGWCADANYMTKEEAEAVISIGTVFRGNTSITHFEEFEYFTSVTSIVENAFYDCTSLTSITFPASVVSTGTRSFFRCRALVDVNITNASILGILTFYSCTSLESIDISRVHTLGNGAFCSCSSLSDIGDVSNIINMGISTGNGVFQETLLQGDYEFTNFTGTIIPTNLFYHVTGITNASFPKSQYTEVGAGAFNGTSIKSFVIREGCLVLNNHSFTSPYMEYLDIPSTVTTWNGFACYYNSNQKVIVCRAAIPPTGLNSTNFVRVPSTCKVYVPNASISAYEAATGWDNLTGRYVPIEGSWYETHRSLCPYDAEIEYLESTGTQYIDTGIIPSTPIDALVVKLNATGNGAGYCGVFDGNGNNDFGIRRFWYGGYYGPTNSRVVIPGSNPNQGWAIWSLSSESRTLLFEGVTTTNSLVITEERTYSGTIWLFGANGTGKGGKTLSSCQIASFQFYRNGTLILDFIPVRIGTTGYMYDKVSGQLFGNSGTGNFVLGPDKN